MSTPFPVTLLLVALASGLAQAQAPAPQRYNVVELSAEAQREVANDLLAAQLYVEENNANPAQLAATLNRALAEAVKLGREFPNVKVRSGNNQTYPVYPPRSNQPSGWRGRAEVRLETRDFAAGTALIGKLQGFMQLGNLGFSVSPEARSAAENELIAEAIARFRARAEIAQKALGGRAYKVQRIALGTGVSGPPPRVMTMARGAAMAEAGVPAPPAEGGATTVSVNVSGAVELE
ncbi:MAG: SIMPL domain-containing protein [Burkholderiales bacterium]|nr:SIMPL domain-containing protein [Burkholderiales bacterium]